MSIRRTAAAGLLAAFCLAWPGSGVGPGPAGASEPWRFVRIPGGGYAESCGVFGRQEICAAVYCVPNSRGLRFGLVGWRPRGRQARRDGRILVDGDGTSVTMALTGGRFEGRPVWRAEIPFDRGRGVLARLKRGYELAVDVSRQGPFYFTLEGSGRAIDRLQRRCARLEGRGGGRYSETDRETDFDQALRDLADALIGEVAPGARPDGRPPERVPERAPERVPERPDGLQVARKGFGPAWSRLGVEAVERREDRDVVRLRRGEGAGQRFDALGLRVLGGAVRVRALRLRYAGGTEETVGLGLALRAGERTSAIDLPGRRGRFLERVELLYDGARGRDARIEVWARLPRG